jgi:hypothetical protein
MAELRLHRRTFLQAAALAVAGTAAGDRLLAGQAQPRAPVVPGLAQVSSDPIADLASALDYDTERILRFVADQIAYEPYPGALRGALGTLESHAGNAVDKASLLAALLGASFVETSFVEGRLDDDAAEALRTAWLADVATLEDRVDRVLRGSATEGVGPTPSVPLDALPAEARALIDGMVADTDMVVGTAADLLDAGVRTITDALERRGIPISAVDDALPDLERERHVWVRIRQGSDWLDLDPTLIGSQAGQVLATPTTTDLTSIPDDLRHGIEIRATVERIAGTGLEQEVILEHLAFADELSGLPIAFSHEQPDGLEGLGMGIGSMLSGATAYQPVLQVGDVMHVGLLGVALQRADDDTLTGALGAEGRDGEATAEWLQVVTVSPTGTRSVADRVLFDRIGPDARAAGPDVASLPPLELAPLTPDGPPEFAPVRAVHFLSVATGATGQRPASYLGEADESVWPLYMVGHLYHTARDAATAVVASERGVRMLHDAPNVVRYTLESVPGATDGGYTAAMDILHRSFRTGDVVGQPAAAAPGVVAGVLSHVMERIAMGAAVPAGEEDISVGVILERAAEAGIPTVVLAPGDRIDGLALDTVARTTLGAALDAGWVAIGPERPVSIASAERIGWWLFDPATGRVVDRLDDGRGIAMVENALQRYAAWLGRHPYIKLGLCVLMCISALYNLLQATDGNVARLALGAGSLAGPVKKLTCG